MENTQIPQKLLDKYNLLTLEQIKRMFDDEKAEIAFYRSFINATNFICNQILEGAKLSDEYADELFYREFARQEINKLNGSEGETVELKPLDSIARKNEANIDFLAMMTDVEL